MCVVHEIGDINRLAEYRQAWRSLLEQTEEASFFQSLEWLETYWTHFSHDQTLRVLVVSSGGQPLGILPLVVRKERRTFVGVRVLTYPLDDWGSYYGPVGPDPGKVLTAGLNHIARSRRDWHVLDLRWINAEGNCRVVTERALRECGFHPHPSVRDVSHIADLHGTWEEYFASRPSKWRNNYRRWERRLARRGKLRYQRYRPGPGADPRWDLYDVCEEIAQKSWQGSSTTGTTLSHASVRDYLRDTHAAAAEVGAIDMSILRLDDTPIAFAYNYHYRGYIFGLRIGYDPAVSRYGIGNLLYVHAIRDSFERGDHTYDLGPGSFEAKRYFLTRSTPMLQYAHFHPTAVRGQLLRIKHYWSRWRQQRRPTTHPATAP